MQSRHSIVESAERSSDRIPNSHTSTYDDQSSLTVALRQTSSGTLLGALLCRTATASHNVPRPSDSDPGDISRPPFSPSGSCVHSDVGSAVCERPILSSIACSRVKTSLLKSLSCKAITFSGRVAAFARGTNTQGRPERRHRRQVSLCSMTHFIFCRRQLTACWLHAIH
jgi:hypothetical protein